MQEQETQKKAPKLFGSSHKTFPHVRYLNNAIRANAKGKNRTFTINYTKKNGDNVVRKVTPLTAKKHLLVAHDHDRGAIRSFDIAAIRNLQSEEPTPIPGVTAQEKTPFWKGFVDKMKGMFTGGPG